MPPGHQLRQYYRYGDVDDCSSQWTLLWDCLKQRTRFRGQTSATHPCLWQLRSREEAAAAWQAEFRHLDAPAAATAGAEQRAEQGVEQAPGADSAMRG
ncbi:hypothetical protein WJX81_004157 [Elliptochloris bilobata]|uniref:Uncharacterized protein n=1 Tax=Elliptochloris bilobata TaxID=381761 RepID=A0AAW1RYY6_9CHLO